MKIVHTLFIIGLFFCSPAFATNNERNLKEFLSIALTYETRVSDEYMGISNAFASSSVKVAATSDVLNTPVRRKQVLQELRELKVELSAAKQRITRLGAEFDQIAMQKMSDDAEFMTGYNNTYGKSVKRMAQFFSNRDRLLSSLIQMLSLFERRQGHFVFEDGSPIFEQDADVSEYNSCLQTLQKCLRIDRNLTQNSSQRRANRRNEINNFINQLN